MKGEEDRLNMDTFLKTGTSIIVRADCQGGRETANVLLRRLSYICSKYETTPQRIVKLGKKECILVDGERLVVGVLPLESKSLLPAHTLLEGSF